MPLLLYPEHSGMSRAGLGKLVGHNEFYRLTEQIEYFGDATNPNE